VTAAASVIERREQERCDALERGDVTALRALLSAGYTHTHADGRVDTRTELLEHLAAGPPRTTERGPLVVAVDGDRAEMVGRCVTTIAAAAGRPGHRISGTAHQVWVLHDGAWLLDAFRFSEVEAIAEL
jgi:hypothetical protein